MRAAFSEAVDLCYIYSHYFLTESYLSFHSGFMIGVNISNLQAFAQLQSGRPLAIFWPLMISPACPGLSALHAFGQRSPFFQDSAQVFCAYWQKHLHWWQTLFNIILTCQRTRKQFMVLMYYSPRSFPNSEQIYFLMYVKIYALLSLCCASCRFSQVLQPDSYLQFTTSNKH